MAKIKILIADDHAIVREGLRTLVSNSQDMEIVGEATNGKEAVEMALKIKPDVILMDLVMPEMDGLEAIKAIKEQQSEANILVLTSFAEDDKVFPAIKAGALGYLLKDSQPSQLLEAIRDVRNGQSFLHPSIAYMLIREIKQPPDLPPTESPLTNREMVVLKLIAQGLTNSQIAEKLIISEWTVRTHTRNILEKLHLANRVQAALYALREGLVDL
ncbi:MAG: response regulator transcription factor [Anaerolineaceae bacterium]|nr:response regulator transcription factor [Anaerolineaceae bacterium]